MPSASNVIRGVENSLQQGANGARNAFSLIKQWIILDATGIILLQTNTYCYNSWNIPMHLWLLVNPDTKMTWPCWSGGQIRNTGFNGIPPELEKPLTISNGDPLMHSIVACSCSAVGTSLGGSLNLKLSCAIRLTGHGWPSVTNSKMLFFYHFCWTLVNSKIKNIKHNLLREITHLPGVRAFVCFCKSKSKSLGSRILYRLPLIAEPLWIWRNIIKTYKAFAVWNA